MIHPEPRDDARGRHDRLPARARRGDRVPAPGGRRELQLDHRRRRMLDERRRRAALVRRGRDRADTGDRRGVRARARTVCRDLSHQIVADGEGATLVAEINVTGAPERREARAIAQRIATSPLVKTALFGRDANWGRVLMAAGSRAVQRRLRARRPGARLALLQRHRRARRRRAAERRAADVEGAVCTIDLDLGLGDGSARLPDQRPLLRLRAHQRGVPLVTRLVVKVGGAVAASRPTASSACARRDMRSSSCTAPGRRSPTRCSGAASRCEFVGGRRRTTHGPSRSCASRWGGQRRALRRARRARRAGVRRP